MRLRRIFTIAGKMKWNRVRRLRLGAKAQPRALAGGRDAGHQPLQPLLSTSIGASTTHRGPSLCGSRNIITTVRTEDSGAERRTNPAPHSKPQHLLQPRPHLSKSAGCTTAPSLTVAGTITVIATDTTTNSTLGTKIISADSSWSSQGQYFKLGAYSGANHIGNPAGDQTQVVYTSWSITH